MLLQCAVCWSGLPGAHVELTSGLRQDHRPRSDLVNSFSSNFLLGFLLVVTELFAGIPFPAGLVLFYFICAFSITGTFPFAFEGFSPEGLSFEGLSFEGLSLGVCPL